MAKTRKQKEKEIERITQHFSEMKSAVFADFTHLSVSDMEDLRGRLREQGTKLKVVKKSLFNLVLDKEKDLEEVRKNLEVPGALSIAFGLEDEIAPAKVLSKFGKEHKKFAIWGGILDGKYLSSDEVSNLATLPSKEQLRGQVVCVIAGPVSGFVNVLSGNLRNLINILKNISKENEDGGNV